LTPVRFLLVPALLLAAHAAELPLKLYTVADGLPYNHVQCIYPDSHGFLWFCTEDGISRFDGTRFVNIRMDQGLPYPVVNDVLEYPRGVYWIATNGGLARFDSSGLPTRTLRVGSIPGANRVNALYRDRRGIFWIGTDGGLFTLAEKGEHVSFEPVTLGLSGHADGVVQIWAFGEDAEGSLWIGTKYGVLRVLPDRRIVHYPIRPALPTDHVLSLLVEPEGTIWAGSEVGLFVFHPEPAALVRTAAGRVSMDDALRSAFLAGTDFPRGASPAIPFARPPRPGEARFVRLAARPAPSRVVGLHRFADGRVWIACFSGGLFEADGARLRAIESGRSVIQDLGGGIAEDRDGNVWLGTLASGAVKLTTRGFVSYGEFDSSLPDVQGVLEDREGRLLIYGGVYQVGIFDGERFHTFPLIRNAGFGDQWQGSASLIVDHLGEWWAATKGGLYRFARVAHTEDLAHAQPKAVYTRRDGLPDTQVVRVFEDSRGDIWTGGWLLPHNSLARWNRASGTFTQFTDADGLPPFAQPSAILEDRSGAIWVSFREGGLARYRDGRFRFFGPADGIPDGSLSTCRIDNAGRLWCVNVQKGLLRIDRHEGDRLDPVIYTSREGVSSSFIGAIGEDAAGLIYTSSAEGLAQIDPADGRVRRFSGSESFPYGRARTIYRDRRGTLWMPTGRGITRFTPGAAPSAPPAPALIGAVRIAGIEAGVPSLGARTLDAGDLPAGSHAVQIDYLSVTFAPDAPLFQYMLEGAETAWSRPTPQRSVNYAHLPPGDYRFLVRTVAGGVPAGPPASVHFRILPPVWRRWWALTLLIAFAASCIFGFESLRARRMRELRRSREERIAELDRVRKAIAADLHDDIGSALTQIAVFSEVVQRKLGISDPSIAEPLAYISRASGELIDSMSDIVWAINPQRDHLSDLVHRMRRFASDTLAACGIRFRLALPGDEQEFRLEGNLRRQVFLIFKEAVNNLVRHSGCTEASIGLKVSRARLTLRVEDNGSGFQPADSGDGHGLAGMRSRAAAMGAAFEIRSSPGAGTVIVLDVPYENS